MPDWKAPEDVAIAVDVDHGSVGAPRVGCENPVVEILLVVQSDVRLPHLGRTDPAPQLTCRNRGNNTTEMTTEMNENYQYIAIVIFFSSL